MILVIGGGSRTGSELVRLLRAAGEPIRILSQPSASGAGADEVPGDLADPASLDAAMAGVSRVFVLAPAVPEEVAWHRNAIDAAARAGVGLLVRSSILGADAESPARFLADHGQVDDYLKSSGVPFTILRPNMYTHNVTSLWPPTIAPDGAFYAPMADARVSMVDARDVAAVAARALTEDGHVGATYELTGPEALDSSEACAGLGAHLSRPIRYVPVDDATAGSALRAAGVPEWLTEGLIELYRDYRASGTNGYAAQVLPTITRITGTKPRSLAESLADGG